MRAWELGPQDGLTSLRVAQREQPKPNDGETLVKVHAACLNHRDLLCLRGHYGLPKSENRIMASDGVGTIAQINGDIHGLAVGQRVISPHFATWLDGKFSPVFFADDVGISRDGWLADYIVLPTSALIAVPDSVTNESAATLAAAGTTVWHGLVSFGAIHPSDLVLTLGTGGVSLFALQIAKAMGAQVAITSSSDDKLEKCKGLGADFTVNYKDRPDWEAALLEQTDGRGADIVIDTIGFAAIEKTIAAAASEGRIAMIGALAGHIGQTPNLFGIIGKNLTLKGLTSGSRAMLDDLMGAVAAHKIKPVVSHIFEFDEAAEAVSYLEKASHMGKVMIKV